MDSLKRELAQMYRFSAKFPLNSMNDPTSQLVSKPADRKSTN